MKTTRIALIALSLTAAAAGSTAAFASDMNGKTRAQVHAELLQAQRDGTLIANNMNGATFRDLNPGQYPARQAATSMTRAQVQAELAEARSNGTLIANNMNGATYRDLHPGLYPAKQAKTTVTRAQVQAELAEARRNGTLIANNMSGATYRDLYPGNFPAKRDNEASLLGLGEISTTTRLN
ncbi:DUF4148 domain-containing protein [Hydrogenophaga crassostreae]|nr:DUF4148 domain-containing protein [Hydrogenophaga crassostreae]